MGQSTTYQPSTQASQVSTTNITYATRTTSPQSSRSQPTTRSTYSSTGSGSNQRRREAEEDEDGREVVEDDDDDDDDNDDDQAESRTSPGHFRVDSGTAAITQSLGSLNIGSSTGNRLQQPSTGPSYTYQSNPQQGGYVYPSSSRQQQSYTYGTAPTPAPQQSYTYSSPPVPATQPTNPRSAVASLPPDVQAHIGYLDRRFIQSGPDPSNAEQLDPRKTARTFQQ